MCRDYSSHGKCYHEILNSSESNFIYREGAIELEWGKKQEVNIFLNFYCKKYFSFISFFSFTILRLE